MQSNRHIFFNNFAEFLYFYQVLESVQLLEKLIEFKISSPYKKISTQKCSFYFPALDTSF